MEKGTPGGGTSGSTVEDDLAADKAELIRLHMEWSSANVGRDIARMQPNFPVGKHLHMYNYNGHTYRGVDELTRLWEINKSIKGAHTTAMGGNEDIEVHVHGDVGWLTASLWFDFRLPIEHGTFSQSDEENPRIHIRTTEVYRRDDGEGNPVWKMWHMHISDCAPSNESKWPNPNP